MKKGTGGKRHVPSSRWISVGFSMRLALNGESGRARWAEGRVANGRERVRDNADDNTRRTIFLVGSRFRQVSAFTEEDTRARSTAGGDGGCGNDVRIGTLISADGRPS